MGVGVGVGVGAQDKEPDLSSFPAELPRSSWAGSHLTQPALQDSLGPSPLPLTWGTPPQPWPELKNFAESQEQSHELNKGSWQEWQVRFLSLVSPQHAPAPGQRGLGSLQPGYLIWGLIGFLMENNMVISECS